MSLSFLTTTSTGDVLHMVRYDLDRSLFWHNLSQETWRGLGAQTVNTLAHVMLVDTLSEISALRKRRREQQNAQREQVLQQLLQPDAF